MPNSESETIMKGDGYYIEKKNNGKNVSYTLYERALGTVDYNILDGWWETIQRPCVYAGDSEKEAVDALWKLRLTDR